MSEPGAVRGALDDAFVFCSEVTISAEHEEQLEQAFRNRVRLVEAAPGFQRLEVWRDASSPGVFLMVTWWDSAARFREYMQSEDHRRSHARIPSEPERPRAAGIRRYTRLLGDGIKAGD